MALPETIELSFEPKSIMTFFIREKARYDSSSFFEIVQAEKILRLL
jgi:hypothetical protein